MTDSVNVVAVILVMGLVTFAIRALPFVASHWLQKHPIVTRLGRFSPLAIMTLLLLHSVVSSAGEHPAGPGPEVLAVAIVVGLQWWRRNPLLSILVGTALYVGVRNFI